MFGARYFGARYFGNHYWGRGGDGAPPVPPPSAAITLANDPRYMGGRKRRKERPVRFRSLAELEQLRDKLPVAPDPAPEPVVVADPPVSVAFVDPMGLAVAVAGIEAPPPIELFAAPPDEPVVEAIAPPEPELVELPAAPEPEPIVEPEPEPEPEPPTLEEQLADLKQRLRAAEQDAAQARAEAAAALKREERAIERAAIEVRAARREAQAAVDRLTTIQRQQRDKAETEARQAANLKRENERRRTMIAQLVAAIDDDDV